MKHSNHPPYHTSTAPQARLTAKARRRPNEERQNAAVHDPGRPLRKLSADHPNPKVSPTNLHPGRTGAPEPLDTGLVTSDASTSPKPGTTSRPAYQHDLEAR